jgi:hypothetical protein
MQKLSETSSGKNNKSCGIFHRESKKIGFALSIFSTIFYAIYRFIFAAGALEVLNSYIYTLALRIGPQE